MFKAIATGKNTCYGKKDEEITISDHFVVTAIKNEWIKMEGLAYVGLGEVLLSLKIKQFK